MLKLTIEPRQDTSLTAAFREQLAAATVTATSLDAVEQQLRAICTAGFWLVTRGGHHVALNYKPAYGFPFRVAMIAEAQS